MLRVGGRTTWPRNWRHTVHAKHQLDTSCAKVGHHPIRRTITETDNVLFTLYAAHQDGYAVDHREVGYHHKQKGLICEPHTDVTHRCGPPHAIGGQPEVMGKLRSLKKATRNSAGDT